MQEVFEKIIERLEKNKESFKDAREKTFCRVTETDDCDSCKADHYLDARLETINSAIEIVKQTAEECNNGWISCSERLPEESLNDVIGWDVYRERCCFVHYIGGRFILGDDTESVKITHWMPTSYQPEGE